ncbi:MAG: NAD(P)/FAD-dependent oxidoreductase [Bacteroidetes bacterium]|nr:NAD(P)/FAD-dependent oxidoreductase [Bacteroidota bacterium]
MSLPPLKGKQKRVLIVGAGFAGLKLSELLPVELFQVILIDKNNYHQFQPLLYQVATSGLEPANICFPLRKVFQKKWNVYMRFTEVTGVNTTAKTITTGIGEIPYDYLVLAYGAVTNFFNNELIEKNAYSMKSVSEALLLRNTLLQNYEKALSANTEEQIDELLNVVIVGGGPTGVELAGAICEMRNKILPKDYSEINFKAMQVYLVEAGNKLIGAMSEKSGTTVQQYLEKLGVTVIKEKAVKNYDGKVVELSDGTSLHSNTLIWAAGVKGSKLQGFKDEVYSRSTRMLVDEFNAVKGVEGVYAIGDIAQMETIEYPKGHPQVAQVALQQAANLARNMVNTEKGKSKTKFEYKDKGSLATVGRNKAVADIKKLKLRGFVAWFVWMAVHLMSIIGVKNKFFVVTNWVWQYFTYDPSLRLIIRAKYRKQ